MNVNALLYYKNIQNLKHSYERKINQLIDCYNQGDPQHDLSDKTFYLFCQAVSTYCRLKQNFETSELDETIKTSIGDSLENLKKECCRLSAVMTEFKLSDKVKFDPTGEFCKCSNYLFADARKPDIKEMLEKASERHRKTMSILRDYKISITDETLDISNSAEEITAPAYQLSKNSMFIEYCLAPIAMIDNDYDLQRVGASIQRTTFDREQQRDIYSDITPQGVMCSFYTYSFSAPEKQMLDDGKTPEMIIMNKKQQGDRFDKILSIVTNDSGLVCTQSQDKSGQIQISKWFDQGDNKVAHSLTFQNQEFTLPDLPQRATKANVDFFRGIRDKVQQLANDWTTPILQQKAYNKLEDIIGDPKQVMFTLRVQTNKAIIKSTTTLDLLSRLRQEEYYKTLRKYMRNHARVATLDKGVEPSQWELIKKTSTKSLTDSLDTLQFIKDAIGRKILDRDTLTSIANIFVHNIIPYDNFASCSIDESIERAVVYSDKLLKLAHYNDKWLSTNDLKYSDAMRSIVNGFSKEEARRFIRDVNDVKKIPEIDHLNRMR